MTHLEWLIFEVIFVVIGIMLLDYFWKGWRGWFYYFVVFCVVLALQYAFIWVQISMLRSSLKVVK